MTKLTAPLFTVGNLVTKTEKISIVMFWTVEEVLATQGTYSYRLVPYKHKYEHLGGWEMEKNLALVEKPGKSTPKFNIDDLVIYGNMLAPFKVASIVEDDVGGFRYYLHGTAGGGATWSYEKDMAKAKQVAQKVFDDHTTPAMKIGTLTHANIELQHKYEALQKRDDELRNALVKILGVNPDNGALLGAVSAMKGVNSGADYLYGNVARLFNKNDHKQYTPAEMFAWIMQLHEDHKHAKKANADLRKQLSWTLDCNTDDKSIFAKIDHVKNLAFNPSKYRVGDEVQFRHDLLNVAHPLSTVTKVKETLPQQDGSYKYKLETKNSGEHMVVKEADLRPVIRGPIEIVDVYVVV